MVANRRIRVGNAGGYWGDDPHAMYRQISSGRLDYLTQDFLAEITMSILQKQRSRKSDLGYATDFLDQILVCLPLIKEKGTKIISNAGGINPLSCAEQVEQIVLDAGSRLRIAVVQGDDLMDRLDEFVKGEKGLENLETGEPFSKIRDRVRSANAYLGAAPVIQALDRGAEIVITGRVTDTAIAAAAPAFEYGWAADAWDCLASAVVAGHILECGAQATGGNITDWRRISSFSRMGYPIAEFEDDGSFVITKHPSTGGVVNQQTVTSQLVYEMGDPSRYITPDVVADFTSIRLQDLGQDRVMISGVRGHPRTDQLKVSISYFDGYKAHGTLIVSRPDAVDKSRAVAETFWSRLGLSFEDSLTELVGYNACHGHLSPAADPPEILLRLGVRDTDRHKVEEFSRIFPSLILSTVPGVAIVGARPRIQEVMAYWPTLVPAERVQSEVLFIESQATFQVSRPEASSRAQDEKEPGGEFSTVSEGSPEPTRKIPERGSSLVRLPLSSLCFGRSGDKGDTCNIGLVARSQEIYDWMVQNLTSEWIKSYFGAIARGPVERFEVPNLLALNFLLHQSLGGGGTVSLRIDPQGKTLADALLAAEVEVPQSLQP